MSKSLVRVVGGPGTVGGGGGFGVGAQGPGSRGGGRSTGRSSAVRTRHEANMTPSNALNIQTS